MGHYYDPATNHPRYELIAKSSGKPRPATYRDAMKNLWVPSVTEIDQDVGDDELSFWAKDQAIKWCYENPRKPDEAIWDYMARARFGGDTIRREAAEFGSTIHDLCEQYALGRIGGASDAPAEFRPFLTPFVEWFDANVDEMIGAETVLTCPEWNVGGKTDLIARLKDGQRYMLDTKTQRAEGGKFNAYPKWIRQLSIYSCMYFFQQEGREHASMDVTDLATASLPVANIVISSVDPHPAHVVNWTPAKKLHGLMCAMQNIKSWIVHRQYAHPDCIWRDGLIIEK